MAENRGGYRKPETPAPVSGPGKLSRRTDGGPTDMKQNQVEITGMGYGENKEMNEIQAQAPLAAAPSVPTAPMEMNITSSAPAPIPLSAPTERPSEPVTTGMDFGPGNGSEMIAVPKQTLDENDRQRALAVMGILQQSAKSPYVTEGTMNLIAALRSELQ
jgi:hypothetical protein